MSSQQELPCSLTTEAKWKRGDVVCLKSAPYFPVTIRKVMPNFACDELGANPQHDGFDYECVWLGPHGQPFQDSIHEDLLMDVPPRPATVPG